MTDTRRKIVPVEATPEMIDAGDACHLYAVPGATVDYAEVETTYTAMIAASPDASEGDELVERVARAAENASYYHEVPPWESHHPVVANWPEIARAILKTIEGGK